MRRTTARLGSCVALGVVLALQGGCALEAPREADYAESAASEPAARKAPEGVAALGYAEGGEPAPTPSPGARKLIKTVVLELRAEDTRAVSEAMQELAAELGGFVGSMSSRRQGEVFHYSLVLRVPVDRLDDALARIKGMDVELDRETVQSEDVTDRFVDLEARLRTLRATETELQGLLAESRQRDYDVEDVMAVYRQLTEIRTQIEQIQGQLQVLGDRTSLATVHVELHPTETARPVVSDRWRPGDTAKRALRGLLTALRFLGDVVIVVAIAVLPVVVVVVLPVALVVWLLVRRARRRRRTG